MKLRQLELNHFRLFDHLVMDFDERLTVLVGVNGSGKTTILDALTVLFSHLNEAIDTGGKKTGRDFSDLDIQLGAKETRNAMTVTLGQKRFSWSIVRTRKNPKRQTQADISDVERLNEYVLELMDREKLPSLPLAVYYDVHRAVLDISLYGFSFNEKIRKDSDFSAYKNALSVANRDFRVFFEWFRHREDIENEYRLHPAARDGGEAENLNYRDPQLEAVRQAIYRLTGFSHMRIRRNPPRMEVLKGEHHLDVRQLSDGEKCLLAMVGDLARRLALVNHNLTDPLDGSAVVMIDEIELHLHPEWQHQVIPGLLNTFPHCQFLITTHSPQVLSHVRFGHIRCLVERENRVEVVIPDGTYGQDSNFLLKTLLGSSYRPKEIETDILRLFELIREDTQAARELLEDLKQRIEGDSPELVRAEALLHRREVLAS